MNSTTIGLDIAKNVFQVHGVDANGKTALRKQLKRSQVLAFFANLPPCLVGLEACAGAHYWARELIKLGHDARLISPQFVKPYVKGNKNENQRKSKQIKEIKEIKRNQRKSKGSDSIDFKFNQFTVAASGSRLYPLRQLQFNQRVYIINREL